jgi:hypothetical protein
MGSRSRRTGAREEHATTKELPGAEKISRTGYPGPDILWRGRWVEVKYRTDDFKRIYNWLDNDASILAIRRPRQRRLYVMDAATLLDLIDEARQ